MGYSHDSFWDQTSRTLSLTFKAANERLEREHNGRAWLAWHTAALTRIKQLPKFERLLMKPKREVQSWETQLHIVKQLNAAFGGTTTVRSRK